MKLIRKIVYTFIFQVAIPNYMKPFEINKAFILVLFLFSQFVFAQTFERCVAHKCAEHKNLFVDFTKTENFNSEAKKADGDIIIPVVVHVVHNEASGAIQGTNISVAQIQSQIVRLNEDFSGNNPELANVPTYFQDITAFGGLGIQFRLAKIDPDGNATNGITRTYTEKESFSYEEDDIKRKLTGGTNGWARDNYLNIWVCPSINNGGALGYAQFPNPNDDALTDGLVVAHNYFGDNTGEVSPENSAAYYKGRTLVHEMGHFFGLMHIWGNDNGTCVGDDGVIDTPQQADSYYGCPEEGTASCDSEDMFMNYMDYTDDECMYLFSVDQAERIYEVLNTHPTRIGLVSAGETAFAECASQAGILLSPNEFNICYEGFTEPLEILGGNENYQTIWLLTQPNGTIEGYQVGEQVSFVGYENGYYGITHINCLASNAIEVFNLIDSNTWTVVSLNSAINESGICATMQTFGYPLFTHLSAAESDDCFTNNSNLLQENFDISFKSSILHIKGITELNLIEFKLYNTSGQLLHQENTTDNFINLANFRGLVLVEITINQERKIVKIAL